MLLSLAQGKKKEKTSREFQAAEKQNLNQPGFWTGEQWWFSPYFPYISPILPLHPQVSIASVTSVPSIRTASSPSAVVVDHAGEGHDIPRATSIITKVKPMSNPD